MNELNEKTKALFKNLNYTVIANLLVLFVSIALNLIVPKFLGVTEYSYWQLYVFYASYVGFFQLGWIDGIYLKIGGMHYNELDKASLKSQFYSLLAFVSTLSIFFILYTFIYVDEAEKKIILIYTSLTLIIMNMKGLISYILQSTNRIKEYAQLSRDDRYIYLIGTLLYLFVGGRNFKVLILLDVISRLIVTIKGMYFIRDILQTKGQRLSVVIIEILDNIKIGINLMLGNIASMLILGISRLFVERKWSIETFGKLSFALSISNMFMIFVNSVSVVLYPILRRTDEKKLPLLYEHLRNIFVPATFGILLLFNPMKILLDWWLPEYQESLIFMGILFPMIVYEGRISLLVNTYLKTIRQEKMILYSNLVALVFTILVTSFSVFIFKNIIISVFSIMLSLIFRTMIAEKLLLIKLKLKLKYIPIIELGLTFVFIGSNILLNSWMSFVVYLLIYIMYLLINFNKVKNSFRYLLSMSKK